MSEKPHYIPFPLFLISGLPDNLDDIFNYGMYYFSTRISRPSLEAALTQVLYGYYNNKLTALLKKKLDKLVKEELFIPEEDYRGFSSEGQFSPETGIPELTQIALGDPVFLDHCIEFCRMKQAMSTLQVTGSIGRILQSAHLIRKQVEERASLHRNDVMVMISIPMMFEYYKNKKTDYEIDLLRGFLAIKSILGKKHLVGTTTDYIRMRMTGAKNKELLSEVLTNPAINKFHAVYSKRYQMDKLLGELVSRGFIKGKLGYNRRIYFSTHFTTAELPNEIHKLLLKNNSKIKRDAHRVEEVNARKHLQSLIRNAKSAP